MATKAEMLADPNSCWNKARDDEEVFVLLGRDKIAPFVVRQWARFFALLNSDIRNIGSTSKPDLRLHMPPEKLRKHDDAMNVAKRMEETINTKIPD